MEQKTVLITGASSGIGKDLSFVYAKHKFNLVLVSRNIEKLNTVKTDIEKQFGVSVTIFSIDLSMPNSAKELLKFIDSEKIEIDILINNAGYGLNGEFVKINIDSQINMMNLNMTTLTQLTYLFANKMINKNKGHIVNIASTAAFQPVYNFAVYAATKAYVLHFSEAIAQELKPYNIKVTAICPGATESNFFNKSGIKKVNFIGVAKSEEVANFIFSSVSKNKVVAIHGFFNKILSFSIRFTPRCLVRKISGMFFD